MTESAVGRHSWSPRGAARASARRGLDDQDGLLSVAGLVGRPVRNPAGATIGRIADVVARWENDTYPPITGLVVRVAGRRAFIPLTDVAELAGDEVLLRSARVDLADFERRPGEVVLMGDVVDHQLVDVDGRRVIRAADLYLARTADRYRLVGADVSATTLLRRLGPARRRSRPTPERVIDWAAIQPFGRPGEPLRLRSGNRAVHRLRPAELADLLEELGRQQRQELLAALEPTTAADALEEMEADALGALLRESSVEQASALLAAMEPDEAAEALRTLDDDERNELLDAMPEPRADELRVLLVHDPGSAGGVMTIALVTAHAEETVADVRARLRAEQDRSQEIDAVLVIDARGAVVDDITLFELLIATDDTRLESLVGPPWPLTVRVDESLRDVVDRFVETRGSSLVVVDGDGRPIGRILADDLVDALAPGRGRRRGLIA